MQTELRSNVNMGRKKSDTLGQFEQIVLAAVMSLRDNAYGVTIHAKVSEMAEKDVNMGAVYVSLERLQEKGFISSSLSDPTPERGGKAKRFFTVERDGALALKESVETSQRVAEAFNESWNLGKWRPKRAKG